MVEDIKKMENKRSKIDIYVDVLELFIIEGKLRQTQLMQKANLRHGTLKEYFLPLFKQGFLTKDLGSRYSITKKGLWYYKKLIETTIRREVLKDMLKKC